jgi:hypothetical protein
MSVSPTLFIIRIQLSESCGSGEGASPCGSGGFRTLTSSLKRRACCRYITGPILDFGSRFRFITFLLAIHLWCGREDSNLHSNAGGLQPLELTYAQRPRIQATVFVTRYLLNHSTSVRNIYLIVFVFCFDRHLTTKRYTIARYRRFPPSMVCPY